MEEGGEGGKQHDHPNSASQATADASSSSGTKALKRPSVENPSATDPCGGTTGASKRPCVEHLSAGAGNHSFVGDHPNSASQVTASAGTKAKAKKIPWAKLKAKLKAKFGQPGDPGWVPSYIVTFEGGRFVSKLAEWDGPLKVPDIFTYPPPPPTPADLFTQKNKMQMQMQMQVQVQVQVLKSSESSQSI